MLRYGRTLIVDESRIMRNLVRHMLVSNGLENIDEAANGADALSLLQRLTYMLVIADWNAEHVPGPDLLRQLRASPRNKDAVFVMTTGRGQKRFASVARDNGRTRYLEKPFAAEMLLNEVKSASHHLSSVPEASAGESRRTGPRFGTAAR